MVQTIPWMTGAEAYCGVNIKYLAVINIELVSMLIFCSFTSFILFISTFHGLAT